MSMMNVTEHLTIDIRGVAVMLVHEVVETVESLYSLRTETLEHRVDGVDEEISMELDRLRFHNVKLNIPAMPDQNIAAVVGALAKELWKDEVNSLLDLHASQDPEYPISFRL